MAVQGLFALQNGFIGFERSGLFFGDRSGERVQIPVCSYLVRTSDALILFDTGFSPRAVPGLIRTDPLARFTDEDLLVHRLDAIESSRRVGPGGPVPLHYDHGGRRRLFQDSELVVQQNEYAYAHYPSTSSGLLLPEELDCRTIAGAASTATRAGPGVTVLRSDGHTAGPPVAPGPIRRPGR